MRQLRFNVFEVTAMALVCAAVGFATGQSAANGDHTVRPAPVCAAPTEDSAVTDPACRYDGGVWYRVR